MGSVTGPSAEHEVDVAILGGGISGLWLLSLLRRKGYSCLLLEKDALGGGQTISSQGILHGGIKYALSGVLSGASRTVGTMPQRWQLCLDGNGEIDLSRVKRLASQQMLWTTRQLGSRLAGFFSDKALRGRMDLLSEMEYPEPFANSGFAGALYRLQETVLDVSSLIDSLVQANVGYITCPQSLRVRRTDDAGVELEGDGLRVRARCAILAAGQGNEGLLHELGQDAPEMQLRPLHMVMLRGPLPELFGHCLGSGETPRITITSHTFEDGERVWYLGGALAESGVGRSESEQINFAAKELAETVPWISLKNTQWSTRWIQRAEVRTLGARRPDGIAVHRHGPVITVWPTKLVLMPALGDQLLKALEQGAVLPCHSETPAVSQSRLPLAVPPWQRSSWRDHA